MFFCLKEKVLHFKQPAGTSRGVYTTRKSWFVHLSDGEREGVGECAPLPDLSCDARPDYAEVLEKMCEEFCQTGEINYERWRDYPSMLFGLETALLSLRSHLSPLTSHPSPLTSHPSPLKYPYTYLYNISNRLSQQFYGAKELSAYELKGGDGPIMQCRHCIRYALGYCVRHGGQRPTWHEPLSLVLGDGRRFRLEFDCKNCQMNVYAP